MITYIIIGITALVSFGCFSNQTLFSKLYFSPYLVYQNRGEAFRFLSHGFVHADSMHLIFNMLTLFFFGPALEGSVMSSPEFLFFYLSAIVFASLPVYPKHKNNPNYIAVGASGAVSAIMYSCVLYYPWSTIYLKFFIPIYFILYAVGYLVYTTYQTRNAQDNIAHDVHLWGALYGLLYTAVLHPESLQLFIAQIFHPPFLD